MDPNVVVVVMGLAAFVAHGPDKAFYIMMPRQAAVREILDDKSLTHTPTLTVYDEKTKKYVTTLINEDFEISLPGAYEFLAEQTEFVKEDEDLGLKPKTTQALVIAEGANILRRECLPAGDHAKCTYTDETGPHPFLRLVGTIRGGRAAMKPFFIKGPSSSKRTRTPKVCDFVEFSPGDDQLGTVTSAKRLLGDAYVVTSPLPSSGAPPVVRLGRSTLTLGLNQDCTRWTREKKPCYPLIVGNLPPASSTASAATSPMAHLHPGAQPGVFYHVDSHLGVMYDLVARQPDDPRPVPLDEVLLSQGPGLSPYKCRTPSIVVSP